MNPELEKKIIEFASQETKKPFQWGVRDCNSLALRLIDLAFCRSLAGAVCGKYDSFKSAVKFQAGFGQTMEQYIEAAGARKVKTGFEQTGDILIVKGPDFHMVHVLVAGQVLSAGPDHGVKMFPKKQIQKYTAWRFE